MKDRNFKTYLNNERKMENRDNKNYFKDVVEITEKAQSVKFNPSDKTATIGIDTTENLSKDELNRFIEELKQLGVSVDVLPNDNPENIEGLRDEYRNSIVFINETNYFENPEKKAALKTTIRSHN